MTSPERRPRTTPEVRPAEPAEAPTLVAFQLAMARETEDLELDRSTVEAGVEAVFRDPARGRYWVAVLDGRIVASLLTTPEWSDWRNGTVLWIQSVYVSPGARRRGVYRAMYATLRRRVGEDPSLKGLRLYVETDNIAAQQTYEALGMSRERYLLYEWMPSGEG